METEGRKDNRENFQLRPENITVGTVTTASGSCYYEIGNCKVIASVFGPRDAVFQKEYNDNGKLWCDVKFAPFARKEYRAKSVDEETRNLSDLIPSILSPSVNLQSFPKSVVEIYIYILEEDGDPLVPCIVAASTALVHANIEMYGLVGACLSCVDQHDSILVDPTSEELQDCKCLTKVVYLEAKDQILYCNHEGAIEPTTCLLTLNSCLNGCRLVTKAMKQALVGA